MVVPTRSSLHVLYLETFVIFLSPLRKCRVSSGALPGVGHGRLVPKSFPVLQFLPFRRYVAQHTSQNKPGKGHNSACFVRKVERRSQTLFFCECLS